MSDEKIFQEIKGIFGWHKKIKEEENKNKNEKEKEKDQILYNSLRPEEKTYNQLKEILNLLKVDASPEEIEALNELANPDGDDEISFERFYSVFVKNDDEIEKENEDLKNAFKHLSKEKNEDFIELTRLEEALALYDPKYKNSMEKILNEIESSKSKRGGKFFFKEYIEEFSSKKNKK